MFDPGTVIDGKYRIERELGRGGMGIVVEATHLKLATRVALKFISDDGGVRLERFFREARAAAQLRSEHICRVLDISDHGPAPYLVMELLEGNDLGKLVRSQPMTTALAVDYIRQACSGLAEAHDRDIVHRDLKPSNLFICRRVDGGALVKIFDFGVAMAPHAGPRLTGSVDLVGSPSYMSPEQITSSRNVDARSDIWSLGVILYRLLVGRLPFSSGNVAELSLQIIEGPTPALPGIAPGLGEVVAKCLEKEPANRYPSVRELAAALAPYGNDSTLANPVVGDSDEATTRDRRARSESDAPTRNRASDRDLPAPTPATPRAAAPSRPARLLTAARPSARRSSVIVLIGGLGLVAVAGVWIASRAGSTSDHPVVNRDAGAASPTTATDASRYYTIDIDAAADALVVDDALIDAGAPIDSQPRKPPRPTGRPPRTNGSGSGSSSDSDDVGSSRL